MSDRDDGKPADATALVGYGKPPAQHRFKTGKSGNPRGRPRNAKVVTAPPPTLTDSLAADLVLLDEAYRPIQLHEGGVPTTLSTVSAVYRSMAVATVKGNRFAQRTFTERVQQAESRRRQQAIEVIDTASKYKEGWTQAIAHADWHGLPRPAVLPHPDDILDGRDGMPYVVGPSNDAEAKHWAKLQARAAEADASILDRRAELSKRSMQKYVAAIFDEIVYEHRIRLMLRYGAPDPDTRRTLHCQRPTMDKIRAFQQSLKTRYRLFAELTDAERKSFLWEVERYDRTLVTSIP